MKPIQKKMLRTKSKLEVSFKDEKDTFEKPKLAFLKRKNKNIEMEGSKAESMRVDDEDKLLRSIEKCMELNMDYIPLRKEDVEGR